MTRPETVTRAFTGGMASWLAVRLAGERGHAAVEAVFLLGGLCVVPVTICMRTKIEQIAVNAILVTGGRKMGWHVLYAPGKNSQTIQEGKHGRGQDHLH